MGWTQKEAGKVFGLKQQAVSKITTNVDNDIRSIQQQYSRTQQAIADRVGLTQQAVAQITKNIDFGKINNSYKEGKYIAYTIIRIRIFYKLHFLR